MTEGAWVVGRNLAGYLPETDTYAYATWQEAAEALACEMREYADADDEAATDNLPEDAADDDLPSMSAHVEACLTDDPPAEGKDWGYVISDSGDRSISFWMAWSTDRRPGDEDD